MRSDSDMMESGAVRPNRYRYGTPCAVVAISLAALAATAAAMAGDAQVVTVVQKDRSFSVANVAIDRGDTIRFTNEDGFLHQMFAHADTFSFDSDEQKPGEEVQVVFPIAGTFQVLCGIHPKMSLRVDVR